MRVCKTLEVGSSPARDSNRRVSKTRCGLVWTVPVIENGQRGYGEMGTRTVCTRLCASSNLATSTMTRPRCYDYFKMPEDAKPGVFSWRPIIKPEPDFTSDSDGASSSTAERLFVEQDGTGSNPVKHPQEAQCNSADGNS